MFSFVLPRSSPVLDLASKCARAVALCVMGGQQWLLGDAYIPKHARAVALCVMGGREWLLGDAYKPKHAQESWGRIPPCLVRFTSPCSPNFSMFSKFRHVCHYIVLSTLHVLPISPCSPNFTMFSNVRHGIVLSTLHVLQIFPCSLMFATV